MFVNFLTDHIAPPNHIRSLWSAERLIELKIVVQSRDNMCLVWCSIKWRGPVQEKLTEYIAPVLPWRWRVSSTCWMGMAWERLTGGHVEASDWFRGTPLTLQLKVASISTRRSSSSCLALWRGQGSQWGGIHDQLDCALQSIAAIYNSLVHPFSSRIFMRLRSWSRGDQTNHGFKLNVPNLEFMRLQHKVT